MKIILTSAKEFKQKNIPVQYDTIIKLALSYYPELKNVHVKFKVKKKLSPLTAQPTFFSFFRKAKNRKYNITISNKTIGKFSPILLSNLSFNAQVGVIGHELSHISDYNNTYGIYFLKLVFMHLSKQKIDKFEYATDMLCIEHGLGFQLLSWSKEVRFKLNLILWKGINQTNFKGRERYMNSESIITEIKRNDVYKSNSN